MTAAGDLENRLEALLRRAAGRCDLAEVYGVTRTATPVEFENNRLKTISTTEHAGVAVRVVAGNRVGFSTTTDLNALEEALDYALAAAAYGAPAGFDLPGPDALLPTRPDTWDDAVPACSLERMLALGERMLAPVRARHPQLQAFAGVSREEGEVLLLNSRGFRGRYRATGFGLFVGGELVEGENMVWAYDGVSRGNLGDPEADADELSARVGGWFDLARVTVPLAGGTYPVLLGPQALADLLRPLVACLDGKAVEKGFSPWAGKLGEQVTGPGVTLVDDGTLPFGPHTAPFDGEGTPCRQTPLVVEGRLETFYLDRRTAARLGLAPTGNGLRSLATQPAPAPTNLILRGGRRPHRELLAELKEGVYIESLLGAWAGNPYAGEVQGNISLGFLVRDGQPVGRIKNCLLAANAFDAFTHRLAELSADARWVDAQLLPYALFDGLAVAAGGGPGPA